MKKKRLAGLEVLRVLAFVAVILAHTGYDLKSGYWGVSIFFVLSGFLLSYNYVDSGRIGKASLKDNLNFAIKKVSRLFLLNLVCTLLMSVNLFTGSYRESIGFILTKIFMNIFMVQEWFPLDGRSINVVSWFLSSICFGYFMFPWFCMRFEKRNGNIEGIFKNIVLLFILQIAVSFGAEHYLSSIHFDGMIVSDLVYWFIYTFPPVRFIEIVTGFYLGYYFLYSERRFSKSVCSVLEVLVSLSGIACSVFLSWYYASAENIIRWWTYSVIFLPQVCLMVYVFAHSEGMATRLLDNRLTRFLADISAEGFLIHYVVFDYLTTAVYLLFGREFESIYGSLINLTLGIFLTIIGCVIWKWLMRKLN